MPRSPNQRSISCLLCGFRSFRCSFATAQDGIAVRRQIPTTIICIGRHAGETRVAYRMQYAQSDRPSRLDEGDDREDLMIVQRVFECGHKRAGDRRHCGKGALFRHMKYLFVGMLPCVAGLVKGGRTPAGISIAKLPQWLPLQVAAMAASAMGPIQVFTEDDRGAIVGVGEVSVDRGGRRAEGRQSSSG